MADILKQSLIKEVNDKFKLHLQNKTIEIETEHNWSCITYVTQDFDLLIEFIYKFQINLQNKPIYFEPSAQWSYIRLPKLKIKWAKRINQVKIGLRSYNVLHGTWDNGSFYPDIESGSQKIEIIPINNNNISECNTVLIPYYSIDKTIKDPELDITVSKQKFKCIYPSTHYNISFNRQGLYINKKYRDKQDIINITEIGDEYIIIEPKSLKITDSSGKAIVIKI
uniref:Uncharacterized protein n=1 Tax=viral metagenome TaxID=1070528 RepID=A0A6C0J9Z7_9ZZZZ